MSGSIENLLVRNLHEVFGERDPARRATAIEAIFDRDCLFSDPCGQHVGHRALDDAVVTLQAQFPDHVFSQIGSVDAPGGSPGYSARCTNRARSSDWTLPS